MDVEIPEYIENSNSQFPVTCFRALNNTSGYRGIARRSERNAYYQDFKLEGGKLIPYTDLNNTSQLFENLESNQALCLSQGDLVYKPELKVWFPIVSAIMLFFICKLAFRLFRGRL